MMQSKYESYSTDEFLEDSFFIEWIKGQSPEAERFWTAWLASGPANLKAMQEAEVQLRAMLSVRRIRAAESDAAGVWELIQYSLDVVHGNSRQIKNRIGGKFPPLYKWMVAAALLLMTGLGIWYYGLQISRESANAALVSKVTNIQPGTDKAILTLSDGSKVILDTADNGTIARQGNVKVVKQNGQLAYETAGAAASVTYNTITTPKGGQYKLILSDGSMVWLNAASSLKFPSAFIGNDRTVELTGEGYFEVAHNADKPFHVRINDMDVKVLGTHFNINAYADEPSIRTTLLEGRVEVKMAENIVILNPGQQAVLHPGENSIKVSYDVDTEEVVAWKNGRFMFNSADINMVMRQIARWYDVEVAYQGEINGTISGNLPRSENISRLLKILEATGKVDFAINGKQIVIKPK